MRLKLIIESHFRTSRGKVFHSLMVEGRKELKYRVVREYIVRMLCALRRLYEVWVSTVGGIKEQRYKGDRLLNILLFSKSFFQTFQSDFFIKSV